MSTTSSRSHSKRTPKVTLNDLHDQVDSLHEELQQILLTQYDDINDPDQLIELAKNIKQKSQGYMNISRDLCTRLMEVGASEEWNKEQFNRKEIHCTSGDTIGFINQR